MEKVKKIIPKIIIAILLFVIILININNNTSFALVNDNIIDAERIEDIVLPEGTIVSRNTIPSYQSQTWTIINDTFLLGASGDYPVGSTGGSEDSVLPAHTHTFTGTQVTSSSNGAHTHSVGFYAGTQSKKTSTSSTTKLKSGTATSKTSTSTGAHQHTVTPTGTISTYEGDTGIGKNMPPYKTYNMYKRTSGGPFTVNVVALNGTISGDTTKTTNAGTSPTFIVNASSGYDNPTVKCTHLQNATISGTTLTVSSVSNNTTCTVQFQKLTAATTLISKAPTTTGTINSDGLMKVEQPSTGQTPALTEYRYSGSNDTVKNYVTFNNETWRIIGVFEVDDGTGNYEQRVKIMRDASIGNYSWDSSESTVNEGYGINEWSQADLKTELNTTYYNRTSGTCYNGSNNSSTTCDFSSIGLNETAKNMIADAKWYTSSYDPSRATSSIAYSSERAATTTQCGSFSGYDCNGESVTRTTSWIGKIALAYPSDYGYASSGCYAGSKVLYIYDDTTCTSTNWMFTGNYKWFLSPLSDYGDLALSVSYGNSVSASRVDYSGGGVWPVTYLKSSVAITGGSGTSSDPYVLAS